jgi:hypothetical protein
MLDKPRSRLIITHLRDHLIFAGSSSVLSFLELTTSTVEKLDRLTNNDRRLTRKIKSLEDALVDACTIGSYVETISAMGKEFEMKKIYLRDIRKTLDLFGFSISNSAFLLVSTTSKVSSTRILKERLFNEDVLTRINSSLPPATPWQRRMHIKGMILDKECIVIDADVADSPRFIIVQDKALPPQKRRAVKHE